MCEAVAANQTHIYMCRYICVENQKEQTSIKISNRTPIMSSYTCEALAANQTHIYMYVLNSKATHVSFKIHNQTYICKHI